MGNRTETLPQGVYTQTVGDPSPAPAGVPVGDRVRIPKSNSRYDTDVPRSKKSPLGSQKGRGHKSRIRADTQEAYYSEA